MADNNIKFKLGSEYSGQGFEKASQALNGCKKELNAAKAGLGDVKTAFSDLSPAANTAVGGVTAFIGAFTTGGLIGGAIQLALKGVSLAIEKIGETMQEAKKRAEEYVKIIRDDLKNALGTTEQQFKSFKSTMDEATNDIKDKMAVLNGEVARQAQNKVYQLHLETIDAITDDMADTEKKIAQEEAKMKEIIIQGEAAHEKHNNTINAYREMVENAKKTREAAEQQVKESHANLVDTQSACMKYLDKRNEIEQRIASLEQDLANESGNQIENMKQLRLSRIELKRLNDDNKEQMDILNDAAKREAQARLDLQNADQSLQRTQDTLQRAMDQSYDIELEFMTKKKLQQQKIDEAIKKDDERLDELDKAEKERIQAIYDERDKLEAMGESNDKLTKAMDSAADKLNKIDTPNQKPNGKGNGNGNGGSDGTIKEIKDDVNSLKRNQFKGDVNVNATAKVDNFGDVDNLDKLVNVGKLDKDSADRIRQGFGSVDDFKKMHKAQEKVDQVMEQQLFKVKEDYIRYYQNLGKPNAFLSKTDQEFNRIMVNDVMSQFSIYKNKQLFENAQGHLLTSKDQENTVTKVLGWLQQNISDKMKLK